jgi:hypothetical protein
MDNEHDTYTEESTESWFDRVRESIKGVATGLVLLVIAFPLLFWNEGRAVRTARGLEEGAGAVVPARADRVDPALDRKLVHVTGQAATDEILRDERFGVSAPGIKLVRRVEMYQWQEKKTTRSRKRGGKTVKETTYSYEKVWSDEAIASRGFKHPRGHLNPARMPHESRTFRAGKVTLGARRLPPSLVDKIGGARDLPVTRKMALGMDGALAARTRLVKGTYYIGRRPSQPEIGDVRVRYSVVAPARVSVVALQTGSTFAPYRTSTGTRIELLQPGAVDARTMFKSALEGNATLTWILRGVGLFLLFFGLLLIFNPIAVVSDIIPVLGDLLRFGSAAFAAAATLVLGGLTIAISWVGHRPLVGILLLAGSVAVLVLLWLLGHARKGRGQRRRVATSST